MGAALRRADGVSLVEMLVAISILSIVLVGVAAGLIQGTGVARESRHRTVAASLAADEIDTVRAATFDLLDEEVVERQVQHETGTYDLRRQTQWVTDATGQSACTVASQVGPDGVTPSYLRVDVAVDWPTRRPSSSPATNATIITPPIELYDPTAGHIAVTVLNALGEPAAGVTVTITGDGAQSRMTDASGCAFFGYLSAVNWVVELDQPGYVDRDGDPNPSEQQLVQPAETASVQFSYDRAVTINTTLISEHGGSVPAEVVRTAAGPEGSQTQSGAAFASLFPFPAGYNVWGGCTDNSPGIFDADTRFAAPLPGTTVNLEVPLPTVEVRSPFLDDDGDGGVERRRVEIEASSASAQPSCANVIDLGQTSVPAPDAGGPSSVRVGLPYGTWRFDDPLSGWCTVVTLEGDERAPGEFIVELEDPSLPDVDCELPDAPGPPTFDLDVIVVGAGQVGRDPVAGPYELGTSVSVTAAADPGWLFAGWTGDVISLLPSESVVMIADRSVTATFVEIPSYTLTTAVSGSGSIDPPSGTLYEENTVATVTATADPGWRFSGWSGDLSGDDNPASVLMDADRSVTATFVEQPDPISVIATWTFPGVGVLGPDAGSDHGVGPFSNPQGLEVFGVMNNNGGTLAPDDYEYPDRPQLRFGSQDGATNLSRAIDNDSYIEFDVVPQSGVELEFESLAYDIARGGTNTPRGLVVRSSQDGFATDLGGGDVGVVRPDVQRVAIDLTGLTSTSDTTTFRLYVYTPDATGNTLEMDNVELRFSVVPT